MQMEISKNSPQKELLQTMTEFLEVAVAMVVYLRGIYPSQAFDRRRYLNIAVQWPRHPQLRDYIHSAITALQPFIEKDKVERLAVVFGDRSDVPFEKFVFKMKLNQFFKPGFPANDIEYALRSFLIKLPYSEPVLQPLPKDCKWEIIGYFKQLPGDLIDKTQYWLPSDTKHWEQLPLITPIKSMSSEPLDLQLYVEHRVDSHDKV